MGRKRQLVVVSLRLLAAVIVFVQLTLGASQKPLLKLEDIPVQADVPYGDDPEQIMDIYPRRLIYVRNETLPTKVIILVHGGGWSKGAKEDVKGTIPAFRVLFPQHVLANMNYRLGTVESPGFPKQVDDIGMAVKYLKGRKDELKIDDPKFGLVGWSAGGHLALLYGYGFDTDKDVNVIANIVGPSALHDASYTNNPGVGDFFKVLVGNVTFADSPEVFAKASPVTYVKNTSPKTIAFYRSKDPIIPLKQGILLEDMLDNFGVYNKRFTYGTEGHMNFTQAESFHLFHKLRLFFTHYL